MLFTASQMDIFLNTRWKRYKNFSLLTFRKLLTFKQEGNKTRHFGIINVLRCLLFLANMYVAPCLIKIKGYLKKWGGGVETFRTISFYFLRPYKKALRVSHCMFLHCLPYTQPLSKQTHSILSIC